MFRRNTDQKGFTVIELTLAMAFLGFILIFTTTTTVQMMRTYNKGLTIKQINQAGRTLTEDLARSLSAGKASDVNTSYVAQGRLCVGNAVYMWTPVYNPDNTYNSNVTTNFNGSAATLIRTDRTSGSAGTCSANGALTLTSSVDRFALLSDQARVLNVDIEQNSDKKLARLIFTLGTYDATEEAALEATPTPIYKNIYNTPYFSGGQLTCRPDSAGNFCAFSTFSTTVYVGN
jgi:hypothetical protein